MKPEKRPTIIPEDLTRSETDLIDRLAIALAIGLFASFFMIGCGSDESKPVETALTTTVTEEPTTTEPEPDTEPEAEADFFENGMLWSNDVYHVEFEFKDGTYTKRSYSGPNVMIEAGTYTRDTAAFKLTPTHVSCPPPNRLTTYTNIPYFISQGETVMMQIGSTNPVFQPKALDTRPTDRISGCYVATSGVPEFVAAELQPIMRD